MSVHEYVYKSLFAAIMFCSTLVNIQTDRHTHINTDTSLTSLCEKAQSAELKNQGTIGPTRCKRMVPELI